MEEGAMKKQDKLMVYYCNGKGGKISSKIIKKPPKNCCREIKNKLCGKGVKRRGLHILEWYPI